MITSVHTMLYSTNADATRAFFRDVFEFPNVDADPSSNWLIFQTGPSELGVHPGEGGTHAISFMSSDIEADVNRLTAQGVEFAGGIEDHGYGFVAMMRVPGVGEVQIYQPKHETAYNL